MKVQGRFACTPYAVPAMSMLRKSKTCFGNIFIESPLVLDIDAAILSFFIKKKQEFVTWSNIQLLRL